MSSPQKKDSGAALDRFYIRLFKDGHLFAALTENYLEKAREMENTGIVKLNDVTYVKCVNFKDKDIRYAHNRQCQGILPFKRLRKYDDRRFYCPDCGREIYPYGKKLFTGWQVGINEAAVLGTVKKWLSELGTSLKEPCTGVMRFECEGAEFHVCIWDYCSDEKYKFPTALSHFKPIIYIYVNADQFRNRIPTGARVVWIKDFLLATEPDFREIFVSAETAVTTPVDVVDVMKFREQERTLPKPSYTFNKKAGFKMKHDVVINPSAVVIDEIEVTSSKNTVSYGIFMFLGGVFLEDQRAGLKRNDYRATSVRKIQINGKEYLDPTSMRKNINRMQKELADKLSDEFKVPFDENEIIENPKGQTGYRLNPNRVTVCMETPEPK